MSGGLLDTSVFIASESGRRLDEHRIPDRLVTSVVTLAELHTGVLAAQDTETRARRLATLESTYDIEVLPMDGDAARFWARMRVHLAEAGRRVRINDLWIAAIAVAHNVPVVTQDGDFEPLEGVAGLEVIRV